MATFCTAILSLLILTATGCSGEEQGSVNHHDDTIIAAIKEVSQVLQGFGETVKECLRLQVQNNDVLNNIRSLPEIVTEVKEQVKQQNGYIDSVKKEVAALSRVDILTEEINDLKKDVENKNREVHDLQTELQNKTNENEQNSLKAQDLNRQLAESQQRVDQLQQELKQLNSSVQTWKPVNSNPECQQRRLKKITQLVKTFNRNNEWGSLINGLKSVLDNSSVEYDQLQNLGSVSDVGFYGFTQLASLLLCGGLHVDTRDSNGDTMLHGAAVVGQLEMVKLLVNHGATIDVRSSDSVTPLARAAWRGQLEVVKYLVQAGADTKLKTKDGHTALYIARFWRRTAVAGFLDQYPH